MPKDLTAYYDALGLVPGAGPLEIQRAYRRLMRRWHPDLFNPGSPMQATAEDITKAANEAFEQLYRRKLYRRFAPRPRPPEPARGGAAAKREKAAAARVRPAQVWKGIRRWTAAAVVAGFAVAAVAIALRSAKPVPKGEAAPAAPVSAAAAAVADPPREAPGPGIRRVPQAPRALSARKVEGLSRLEERERALARTGPGMPVARPRGAQAPDGFPAREIQGGRAHVRPASLALSTRAFSAAVARADALFDFFEIGDPRARVLAVQGEPDDACDGILRYGSALVYLEDGVVSGWSDDEARLRVRSWTVIEPVSIDFFSVGSTPADVVRAQGLPGQVTASAYYYGSSAVYFRDARVTGWNGGDVLLRGFRIPDLGAR